MTYEEALEIALRLTQAGDHRNYDLTHSGIDSINCNGCIMADKIVKALLVAYTKGQENAIKH